MNQGSMQQSFQLFQQWMQFQKMQQDLVQYQQNLMKQQKMMNSGNKVDVGQLMSSNMKNLNSFYSRMGEASQPEKPGAQTSKMEYQPPYT